ncbi:MAG: DUF4124 domain-containing protein [Deltaproteobacteria bacterium]|nr:DUF4124 domain-containing protein [Deltaproteobacteria bacterium]
MPRAFVLFIVFWVLFPAATHAEIYRYTDQNGVLRFTDNIANVPESQRKNVLSYPETDDISKPELIEIKAELDKENAELMKQLEAFSKGRNILSTHKTSKDYKEQLESFNKRLADYEKRRRLFQEKLNAYNSEIGK